MIERLSLTLGRCLLGLYFLIPGLTKIPGYTDTANYMTLHEVPMVWLLLPVTIILQVGGGLLLIAGIRIKLVALVLAGLTILINVGMHDFWNSYPGVDAGHETQNFVKNLAIFGGLLVLASTDAVNQWRLSRP